MPKEIRTTVEEMENSCPPVSAIEALRRNLLYAMFQGVTKDDMTAIVAKQVQMARHGDSRAARLIMDMVRTSGEPQRVSVTSTQSVQVVNPLDDLRCRIALEIAARGPRKSAVLASALVIDHGQLMEAVNDHPWFEREPDGLHVTADGRAAVLNGANLNGQRGESDE